MSDNKLAALLYHIQGPYLLSGEILFCDAERYSAECWRLYWQVTSRFCSPLETNSVRSTRPFVPTMLSMELQFF